MGRRGTRPSGFEKKTLRVGFEKKTLRVGLEKKTLRVWRVGGVKDPQGSKRKP